MKVQANNFTVFWGGKAIAYATTAELDASADTYEVGSPTSGGWRRYKKGRKGWTISAGHLYDLRGADEVGTSNYRSGWDMLISDQTVEVAFGAIEPHGVLAAKDQKLTGATIYKGTALVRRFTVSAVKGQYVTCQFEAVGCGALTEVKNPSGMVLGLGVQGTDKLGVFGNE